MSVIQSIKNIYRGPFTQFQNISEQIGGEIYDQVKLIDTLFSLQINLVSVTHKYKKPIQDYQQFIFTRPMSKQITFINNVRKSNTSFPFSHLNLICECVEIFRWTEQTDVVTFVDEIRKNAAPHLNKLKTELLKLDIRHVDWIHFWNEWFEGVCNFLVHFYSKGLNWCGNDTLPMYFLGDMSEIIRKFNHERLVEEINQESDNIVNLLRPSNVEAEPEDNEGTEEGSLS